MPVLGTGLDALILPSITLGLFLAGGLARLVRNSIIEVMAQDYIRTAYAKGLTALRVVAKHAMRNAIIPPLTLLGIQFALLIGGAVVTETVFARPGHRSPARARGAGEGLSGRAGRRRADHRRLCADQPGDRHRLRHHRSAGAGVTRVARLLGAPGAVAGSVVLVAILALAALAPLLAPYDWNATSQCRRLAPMSAEHWFGCDLFGRDILSRVMYGARFSLAMGISTVAISLVFGALLGVTIAYAGGRVDAIGARLIDAMLCFPPIILAILIVAVLGVGLWNAALAVGISGIPRFARITRAATLSLAARDFVEAARAVGAGRMRIVLRHLLPNLAPILIVLTTLDLGGAVLFTATLSFLGLGAQPPTPEWGAMLNAGREYVRYAPWTMIFPGLALFLTVMAVNLVGDRFSLVLDPRQRGRA